MEGKSEQEKKYLRGQSKLTFNRNAIQASAVLSLLLILLWNPMGNNAITQWDRNFSTAVEFGIDAGHRVKNFYIMFVALVATFTVVWLCASHVMQNSKKGYFDFLNKFCGGALMCTIATWITKYGDKDGTEQQIGIAIKILLGFVFLVAVLLLVDRRGVLQEGDLFFFLWAYISTFLAIKLLLGGVSLAAQFPGWIALGITAAVALIYLLALSRSSNPERIRATQCGLSVLFWLPAAVCLMTEILFALNGRGFYVGNYIPAAGILTAAMVMLAVILCIVKSEKANPNHHLKVGYNRVGVICSLVLCYTSVPYQQVWNYGSFSNLYEVSNGSVSAETVLSGKIPIVDYFSAHALTDVLTRLLYIFTNDDIKAAVTNPYAVLSNAIGFLMLYLLLKAVFNDADIAAMITVFCPLFHASVKLAGLCMISILATKYLLTKPNTKKYILFWVSQALSLAILYDEGMSLGIACVLVVGTLSLSKKYGLQFKKYLAAGAAVAGSIILLYFGYALATGIPPVQRVREWIALSAQSNGTWATGYIGDATTLAFFVSYFLAPVTAFAALACGTFFLKQNEKVNIPAILLVVFSIAQILYIPRTMTFHNLSASNGSTGVLLNYFHWTVALLLLCLYKYNGEKREHQKQRTGALYVFSISLMSAIVLEGITVTGFLPGQTTLDWAATAAETNVIKSDMSEIKDQPRIVYSEETDRLITDLKNVTDLLLEPQQTYFDFSNMTSLYVLLGRPRPGYVAQIPSLLTTEYSQRCFLDELKDYDAPLALVGQPTEGGCLWSAESVPHNLTYYTAGIAHNIRYYTIAEHLYREYEPLVRVGKLTFWCTKGSYEKYAAQLTDSGLLNENCTLVWYGYDQDLGAHSYELKEIPYIWATYDSKNAAGGETAAELTQIQPGVFRFDGSQTLDSSENYYLMVQCEAETEETMTVRIQSGDLIDTALVYSMNAHAGDNLYLVRLSSDYNWWAYNLDTVAVYSEANLNAVTARVIYGD